MAESSRLKIRFAGLALILTADLAAAFLLRDLLSFDALARHRVTIPALRDAHFLATEVVFLTGYMAIVAFSVPGASVAS